MACDPDKNEDNSLTTVLLSEVREAWHDDPSDEDEPRDSVGWRWAKFLSIILASGLLFGGGFALEDYVTQYNGRTWTQRQSARRIVENDSSRSMSIRFMIGACFGSGLGAMYVIRCLVKKVDP